MKDAGTAISEGGQTLGGWGAAFYYWNVPYTQDGKTPGEVILSDPAQYEKFIALNAFAATEVAAKFGVTLD